MLVSSEKGSHSDSDSGRGLEPQNTLVLKHFNKKNQIHKVAEHMGNT